MDKKELAASVITMFKMFKKIFSIKKPEIATTEDFMSVLGESKFKRNTDFLRLISELNNNSSVSDAEVIRGVEKFQSCVQTNCDSAAQCLFSVVGIICSSRPSVAKYILVHPLQALYYLGVESLNEINDYIKWFIAYPEPYMGSPPDTAYKWLNGLLQQEKLLVSAFRIMYEAEENNLKLPEILK